MADPFYMPFQMGLPPPPPQPPDPNSTEALLEIIRRSQREEEFKRVTGIDPTAPDFQERVLQSPFGAPAMAGLRGAPSLSRGAIAGGAFSAGMMPSAASPQELTRRQRREMEMERQREERASKLRREEEEARRKGGLETEEARKEREEYDRAVQRAESARDAELAKARRFQDTWTGQAWDQAGGLAPAILGAASGFMRRGVNPNVSHRSLMGMGALGGAAATNIPLGYDAFFTPVENPDRRATEAYGRELPPTHPRKQEWLEYARGLPQGNPIREQAQSELFDPMKAGERMLFGGIEGALGSEFGSGAWSIPARGLSAARRLASPPKPPTGPAGGGGGTPLGGGPSMPPSPPGLSSLGTQLPLAPLAVLGGQTGPMRLPPSPPQPPLPATLPSPLGAPTRSGHRWDDRVGRWRDAGGAFVPGKKPD